VNVEGIKPGQLRFTGLLLADIFLGKIKTWNDPAIAAVNPDLKLPNQPIIVVHRIDVSGTTFNWSNYLSKVSASWKAQVGEGASLEWPLGVGGRGNDGVASSVALISGAIGYLEYAYALQKLDRISYGIVQNSAGNYVSPNVESFQAAASSADWKNATDFYLTMTNAPGANAYPITAATFILMYKHPKSPENSKIAIDLFKSALERGQAQAEALHYVSLPAELVQQIETYWQASFTEAAVSASASGK
jgi:phosphate transport system substrate-binding protein